MLQDLTWVSNPGESGNLREAECEPCLQVALKRGQLGLEVGDSEAWDFPESGGACCARAVDNSTSQRALARIVLL